MVEILALPIFHASQALVVCFALLQRSYLNPAFIFITCLWIFFFSDFNIVGYSNTHIQAFEKSEVLYAQIVVALSVLLLAAIVFFLSIIERRRNKVARDFFISMRRIKILALLAILSITAEYLIRLSTVNFDLLQFIHFQFGPRHGVRPWRVGLENDLATLNRIIVPAAVTLAGVIFLAQRLYSFAALYILGMALVVGDGARTFAIIPIVIPAMYYLYNERSFTRRVTVIFSAVAAVIVITSSMIAHRTEGLLQGISGTGLTITYHQDDSYYRVLGLITRVQSAPEPPSITDFVLGSAFNFVPRRLWPSKPSFDASFWGDHRLPWVTVSFFGEMIIFFGYAGIAAFLMTGIMLYSFLKIVHAKYLVGRGDIVFYLIVAFWVYMMMRSLQNFSLIGYIPFAYWFAAHIFPRLRFRVDHTNRN